MSGPPLHGYFGISEVLAQLRADFPDVSVSKIRFLETEGLLTPARSPSGYRRFCAADVDRLRYILAAQRDHYLPLRVIRERLARLETDPAEYRGAAEPAVHQDPASYPGDGIQPGQLLSRRELVEAAGLTDALLTELETFGLLRRIGRQYAPEALQVARMAMALTAYGVEARHLRAVRAAAERETTMIESLVAPIQRQRGAGARDLAARTAGELAELVLGLHAALVDGALAEAGLVQGPVGEAPVGQSDSGRAARGVAGASA
ncbi:MAG TPA: MerR family transcriptional regulator [Streptosporangiaceae bacterium]|nr:MerR family transcriptional regulator [Streptosporangiaceae bacterium]